MYMYVCVCVYVFQNWFEIQFSILIKFVFQIILQYIYIYNISSEEQDMTQGQFLAEFNRFKFKVFVLLDRLPYQS